MTHSNAAQQAKTALLALAAPAVPITKIDQFRALLPDIEARIADGVPHAQIIAALASASLYMTESEFRNALCRERKRLRQPKKGSPHESRQTPTPPATQPAAQPRQPAHGDHRLQRESKPDW